MTQGNRSNENLASGIGRPTAKPAMAKPSSSDLKAILMIPKSSNPDAQKAHPGISLDDKQQIVVFNLRGLEQHVVAYIDNNRFGFLLETTQGQKIISLNNESNSDLDFSGYKWAQVYAEGSKDYQRIRVRYATGKVNMVTWIRTVRSNLRVKVDLNSPAVTWKKSVNLKRCHTL
jgi:hypothetical protein